MQYSPGSMKKPECKGGGICPFLLAKGQEIGHNSYHKCMLEMETVCNDASTIRPHSGAIYNTKVILDYYLLIFLPCVR